MNSVNNQLAQSGSGISVESRGLLLGFSAVICFAFTLPLTRHVTQFIDPWLLGVGRTVLAAPVAALLLWFGKAKRPTNRQFRDIAIGATGVTLVFPVCIALAMNLTGATRGGVIFGSLPLATAVMASVLAKEKMPVQFWGAAILGAFLMLLYSYLSSSLSVANSWGDLLLILAVIFGGLGYALEGKLSREMPSWQVICWTVVMAAPLLLIPMLYLLPAREIELPVSGWLSLAYLVLVSQLFGFFLWNKGLAIGGIARVSQIQLLQPFVTLMIASILFDEQLTVLIIIFAALITAVVFAAKILSNR